MNKKNNSGFTVIELMLSSVVFSLVLLLVMAAIMQITRLYYRGVTQANTQEVARAVSDDITQAIQFSKNSIFVGPYNPSGPDLAVDANNDLGVICIGGRRYSFALDRKLVTSDPQGKQKKHVLWVDQPENGCSDAASVVPVDLNDDDAVDATNGKELLGNNMRLTNFSVTQLDPTDDSLWKVSISVGYGDDDLLVLSTDKTHKVCEGSRLGIEFCAFSDISTIVRRRVK